MPRASPLPSSESNNKKKRKRTHTSEPEQHEQSEHRSFQKKLHPSLPWNNLDLVLSLQSKDLPLSSKIDLAFGYTNMKDDVDVDRLWEPLRTTRVVVFLGNWMQHSMISSEKNDGGSAVSGLCSDVRCWIVLEFCLKRSSYRVSTNILRPVCSVVRQAVTWLESSDLSRKDEFLRLYSGVAECISVLFGLHGRVVNNAGVDLWMSCAVAAISMLGRVFSDGRVEWLGLDVLQQLCSLILEQFSTFLRFHPSPKNTFQPFVDRVLEPLLEFIAILRQRMDGGDLEGAKARLLATLNGVLSNGLFHPSHMNGFLALKSMNMWQEGDEKTVLGSYHRHLFQKVEKIVSEKKGLVMAGLGDIFGCFITKAKNAREGHVFSKCGRIIEKDPEASEAGKQSSQPLFEIFMHLMKPLVCRCKEYLDLDLLKIWSTESTHLSDALCVVTSMNMILAKLIHEKVYTGMNDTTEVETYNFLKEVFSIIISMSKKLAYSRLSNLNLGRSRDATVLMSMTIELLVAVGYLLEIEYRIIGDNLVVVWHVMLSNLVASMSSMHLEDTSLLLMKVLHVGCQMIKLYSELRQVDSPIFALLRAVRLFFPKDNSEADFVLFFSGESLSSKCIAKAVASCLFSQLFKFTTSNAIKSIPEGQASKFVEQLKEDVEYSLEWIKSGTLMSGGRDLGESAPLNDCKQDLVFQLELFGMLSEFYAVLLDSLPVKASNSNSVAYAIDDMLSTIRPSLSFLVDHSVVDANKFLYSVTGIKFRKQIPSQLQTSSAAVKVCASWLLIFLFRIYISCRSLYCQVICLMPRSAKKAADAMGSMFLVAQGESWTKLNFSGNYFTWISASSISLPSVIEVILTAFLQRNTSAYAPFIHVLFTMALQRLVDLNQQIKSLIFLHNKCMPCISLNKEHHDADAPHIEVVNMKRLIEVSKEEAFNITSFMTGYLSSIVSTEDCFSIWNTNSMDDDIWSWDFGIYSLTEKTLPVAIWWLLCKNIDVWCEHAAKKRVKEYISLVINHALPPILTDSHLGNNGMQTCSIEVMMHLVSSRLLMDPLFYEHKALSKQFMSRFLRKLKSSLRHIFSSTCANSADFNLLPDWSETLHVLEKNSLFDGHVEQASDLGSMRDMSSMELRMCYSLVNLLCRIIKFHVNGRSIKNIATCILNLERLVLLSLLRCKDDSFPFNHLELLKFFVSCRRLLRYLAVASFDGLMCDKQSAFGLVLCENPLSISWLLISVGWTVSLPYCFFGKENYCETKGLFFSLMEHSSYIFFELTKGLLVAGVHSASDDETTSGEPSTGDKPREHIISELPSGFRSNAQYNAWQKLDIVVENLKVIAENSLNCCNGDLFGSVHSDSVSSSCNKVACVVSCIQGFLSGLASTLSSKDDKAFKEGIAMFLQSCISKLCCHINIFNDFVNTCLRMCLVDDRSIKTSCNPNVASKFQFEGHSVIADSLSTDVVNFGNNGREHQSSKQCDSSTVYENDEREKFPNHFVDLSATDLLGVIPSIDISRFQVQKLNLLQRLLKGELPEMAFLCNQLFVSSAAVLHLYSTPLSKALTLKRSHKQSSLGSVIVGTSYHALLELSEINEIPNLFCYTWLDGIIKYLESLGHYFSFIDPTVSRNTVSSLIDAHLRAMGKCISLLGKGAVLASHETRSSAKLLQSKSKSTKNDIPHFDHDGYCMNVLRARLRSSFMMLIKTPFKSHLSSAIQAIERALVGVQKGLHMIYEVNTGNLDGGRVSSIVAAGIDFLDVIIESVLGNSPPIILKKHMQNLLGSLFSIVGHLHGPMIFHKVKLHDDMRESYPDTGAVILMCVEILRKVSEKSSAYHMDPCLVGQSLNLPLSLFHSFRHSNVSQIQHAESTCPVIVDRHFTVDLYAACCRLLSVTLRHRKSETGPCIFLLQDSLNALLICLETTDVDNPKKYFAWETHEAVKCATFLRRVYEEIRQQKDLMARFATNLLSNYITVSSGFGPLKSGIERDVDEALRPGIYALIDICSPDDLQLLHTVLEEGSCRRTLATVQHDYKLNFLYVGKV